VEDPSTQLGLPAHGDPVFIAKALSQSKSYLSALEMSHDKALYKSTNTLLYFMFVTATGISGM